MLPLYRLATATLLSHFVAMHVIGVCHAQETPSAFAFRDVTAKAGLRPALDQIRGHAAGWGDVDGDGWNDLYVATFHTSGSKPNLLLRNRMGAFHLDEQPQLRISTRASAALFADLDNDGDLDLYVGSMPAAAGSELAEKEGHSIAGCSLFRNDGNGRFTDVSAENGACPAAFGARSATVLDYDGDGLLDLLVGEDPLAGYNGSPTTSSRLFKNLGDLSFADASREAGLPEGIPAFGVAAQDVTGDGWPDFFLAAPGNGNRLFINDRNGKFHEPAGSRETFAWPTSGGDNMVCGVCFGDVNGDGLPDIVIGQHFQHPWREPVANRLYVHRGTTDNVPTFKDVTEQSGLVPLPMKAPHVEIQDFNNDGTPDICTTIVKLADGTPHPVIFQGVGLRDGAPRFSVTGLDVNDFPTAKDSDIEGSKAFFDKMIADGKVLYTAAGPVADYDNDGRLDMFLASWWLELPSLLLRNESPSGHWLRLRVEGPPGVNRMGIGAVVRVYRAGGLDLKAEPIGSREIAAGYGYASGQPAEVHFGLGETERVDVEAILPHARGKILRRDVSVDQVLLMRQ